MRSGRGPGSNRSSRSRSVRGGRDFRPSSVFEVPETFEDGDGAGLSDGSEAMVGSELRRGVPEGLGGELGAAVSDENFEYP
jgi:hypothetical protein